MRVLVTGSRNWIDRECIREQLVALPPGSVLIHGAARGADSIAAEIAQELGLAVEAYPAQWQRYGRGAGLVRNTAMLQEGKPEIVLAFPCDLEQSRGTNDMVTKARKAGIPVRIFEKASS